MATYSDLKNNLQLLIDRTDVTALVGNTEVNLLDAFIERAELDFYRSAAARIPPFEKVVTYTLLVNSNVNELAIPGDFFSLRYMTASSGDTQVKLKRVTIDEVLNSNTSHYSARLPYSFAYGSNNWLLPSNASETTVKVYYHGSLTDLKTAGDTDDSHWLLNNGKDVMLYLAAVEAAIYFDFDRAQLEAWVARAEALKQQIITQWNIQVSAGGTTRVKSRYRRR